MIIQRVLLSLTQFPLTLTAYITMIFIKIKKPKIVTLLLKSSIYLDLTNFSAHSIFLFWDSIQNITLHQVIVLSELFWYSILSIVILTITNIFILVIALGIININVTFHYQFRINICHFYWNVQNIPLFKIFYLPSCVLYPSYVLYQCILKPQKIML